MRTKLLLFLLLIIGLGLMIAPVQAQVYVHPVSNHYKPLKVDVWTDQPEGSVYYQGESIRIYFRANQDCYVTLYNIDSEGYIHRLWPTNRYDDNFIRGFRTYSVPDRYDRYELRVGGPDGIEYIQAVASIEPYDVPPFDFHEPTSYRHGEWDVSFGVVWGDPYIAIDHINYYCIPDWHWHRNYTATDMTHFYVDRYVYYPRTVCSDCHWGGRYINDWRHFDPYYDPCPKYVIHIDVGFDHHYYDYNHDRPRHNEGRYRYKERSDDNYRYKKSYDTRRYKSDGDPDGRYKKGYVNVESPPLEDPPAKHISSKSERDRYKDPNPADKYARTEKQIVPSDAISSSRFTKKNEPARNDAKSDRRADKPKTDEEYRSKSTDRPQKTKDDRKDDAYRKDKGDAREDRYNRYRSDDDDKYEIYRRSRSSDADKSKSESRAPAYQGSSRSDDNRDQKSEPSRSYKRDDKSDKSDSRYTPSPRKSSDKPSGYSIKTKKESKSDKVSKSRSDEVKKSYSKPSDDEDEKKLQSRSKSSSREKSKSKKSDRDDDSDDRSKKK